MTLSVYAVYDGFNVAEVTLVTLAPQPATPDLVRYAELEFYGDRHAEFNGARSAELVWNALATAERAAVLTALGVSDTIASNDVTMNLLLSDRTWLRVNCTAVYMQTDTRRPYGSDNLRIQLIGIEAAS